MIEPVDTLAAALAAARLNLGPLVAAERLHPLDERKALAVQATMFAYLDAEAPVAKVSNPPGGSQAALISSREVIGSDERLTLGGGVLLGAEIEVAAVLGRDLGPEEARLGYDAVRDAIESYRVGIELIGTRIDDHRRAGPFGTLADGMISMGYVIGQQRLETQPDIDGQPVSATIDGREADLDLAKHPFGDVVEPILAWIRSPSAAMVPLRAGMIVTTGSLVPLLDIPTRGTITMQLGPFDPISFSLRPA